MNIKAIIEAALMVAGKALTVDNLKNLFSEDENAPDTKKVKEILAAIATDCEKLGYELKELSSGYRYQVKQEHATWVSRLWEEKPPKYSKALLEIIAIIAYKQPVTRAEIEEIRGVAVSTNSVRTLLDKQWVKVIAHKDVPGRPAVYGTTKEFLDYFNLSHLRDLPELDFSKLEFATVESDDDDSLSKGFRLDEALEDVESDLETSEVSEDAAEGHQPDSTVIDISEEFLKKQQENHQLHAEDDDIEIIDAGNAS